MLKFILVLFLFFSCSSSTGYPIDLIFGLKSYMPMKTVQNIIEQRNGTYDIIEDTCISDKRPKYKFSKIRTTIFKYKGLNGSTFLEFFNNQLMSVTFYPKNKKNIFMIDDIEPNSIVTINHDIENKFYIRWSDKKLERKFQNWIQRYS